jgi:hypothetical protein
MPASVLRVVYLGAEQLNTWGASTKAPTVKLMGLTDASLSIVDEVDQPELVGTLAPATVAAQAAQHGEGHVEQRASYQDICYWLDGIFGPATASAAANTTYTYNYEAPLTASTTPQHYTVQFGTTDAEYEMDGGIVNNLMLNVEAGQIWTVGADLLGHSIGTAALATCADRDVDLIKASDTTIYMDSWASATIGATELAATLISAELTVNPGRHLKTFVGSVTPEAYGENRWEGQLVTVLEFNSSAKAIVDALLAPALVQRQIRIRATQGATTAYRLAQIDFAGTLVDGAELFGDRDGNMTVSLTWNGTVNTVWDNWFAAKVTNELSVLP